MLFQFVCVVTLLFHNASIAKAGDSTHTNGSEKAESTRCGTVPQRGIALRSVTSKRGDIPWQASIYTKTTKPYRFICGGSLVRNDIVISAGHCFWSITDKKLPASQYAVAVGKLNRSWTDPIDEAQKSDVKEIHLPPRFQGPASNYQDDIAVLLLASPFTYNEFIRPVCLSFDTQLENQQLQPGNEGKFASWGQEDQLSPPVLHVVSLPYVNLETCLNQVPIDFREYISSDKFCAGSSDNPDSVLCKGDGGSGLSFAASEHGIDTYYLRGIVSVSPTSDSLCSSSLSGFTKITAHESFIKQYSTKS